MKKAAVIGNPIAHSRSPIIHNYWLKKHGIEGHYEAIKAEDEKDLEKVITRLIDEGYSGFNVTTPFKGRAFDLCDTIGIQNSLQDHRKSLVTTKSVNSVKIKNGKLFGDSTDIFGFYNGAFHQVGEIEFSKASYEKNVTILGAGGAARTIAYSLVDHQKAPPRQLTILNRSHERASLLCKSLNELSNYKLPSKSVNIKHHDLDTESFKRETKDCDLLINCTTMGMDGGAKELNFDFANCRESLVVYDIVYSPIETGLLKKANSRGLRTIKGIGMLIYQAAPAFNSFFGVWPDVDDDIFNLLEEDLKVRK
jgi:shikimate dehydrogenase